MNFVKSLLGFWRIMLVANPLTKFKTAIVLTLLIAIFALPLVTLAATYLTSELQVGSSGNQVTQLQLFLSEDPTIYPEGLVTGYFGPLTKQAVIRFQTRYGIPTVGRVGPMTLAKINALGSLANSNVDISAPSMSSVVVGSLNSTGSQTGSTTNMTLSWNTGESSRAKVYFDRVPLTAIEASANFTEPIISGMVLADSTFGLGHTLYLNNAMTNALYYFRAVSIDANGNVSVSPQGSFIAR